MLTFSHWPWHHWGQLHPARPAIILHNQSLSWQQLCQQTSQLAASFHQQGITENHLVALRGKNSLQFVLSMLALWQCGARVLPVNPQLPPPLLQQLQTEIQPHCGIDLTGENAIASLPLLHTRPDNASYCVAWQPKRLLSLILTSGSTAGAKAAAHNACNHLACARGVLSLISFTKEDCWLLSLPLYHVSGLGILWRWLLAGAQLALRQNQPLDQALANCTHASLVPTQLWRLLRLQSPLPQLKAVLLGGAAIPADLVNAAQQRGIACWCGYGLTEFASTVCAKRADGQPDAGSVLPGSEIRIVASEIWLRGAGMAAGYWRNGALHPLVNPQGWFATGDRGALQHQRLIIQGRLDNRFFNAGEAVQPEQIEQIIASHPAVQQIFIVPLADAEFGHIPVALAEINESADYASLRQWANHQLPRWQQPRHWLPLPAELQNGGIKISRLRLRQWVAQQFASGQPAIAALNRDCMR